VKATLMSPLRLTALLILLLVGQKNVFGADTAAEAIKRPDFFLAASKKKPATKPPAKPPTKPGAKPSPKLPEKPAPAPAPPTASDDEMQLAASGAIALDAISGDTVYAKNADSRHYPASTTKIMTALIVIEAGSLEQEVEIAKSDRQVGESSLDLVQGERFSREQLLYGLMLKSANDVAHALGRDNAGSIEEFASKMNSRARELGCVSTHFMNPHGLHHSEHYTSPRDLGLIARAAMQQPLFRRIVSTREALWNSATSGERTLWNHNHLLKSFPGCCGVKTGYTSPAQQVLVSAAVRDGREAIAVVMHSNKPGIWEDSKKLLERALSSPAPPPEEQTDRVGPR
jgi:D-alanyl-D-alanine carboxypeptidase (penicillin-binding protein 5/6)